MTAATTSAPAPSDGTIPFFTIVIPTMNRPRLLSAAIESVVRQTFADFEVVVSDNSNDEAARAQNAALAQKYATDSRIRFVRPDRWMSMPDHWEFATRHATGRYVAVLTDRHAFRPSALATLSRQIAQLPDDCPVISWHVASTLSAWGIVNTAPFTGNIEIVDSLTIAREFAGCGNWRTELAWSNRLPRTLISCYRRDIADIIRAKHGSMFLPLTPDYTSACLLLAYSRRVAIIDAPLIMNHGSESNGRDVVIHGINKYLTTLGDVDSADGIPAPFPTVTHTVIRDVMKVKSLVAPLFESVVVDPVGYFMCNYRELQHMERLGTQIDVAALYRDWWQASAKLPPQQQERVRAYARELDQQRVPLVGVRRLSVRLNIDPVYHAILETLRLARHRLAGRPVYANVLEAAAETDYMLSPKSI